MNLENTNNKGFKQQTTISSFSQSGNTFIRISPNPYISFEILPKNNINLNRLGIYNLIRKLINIAKKFSDKNLYSIYNNKLVLNKELSKLYKESLSCNGHTMSIAHVIVPDDNNPNIEYEGVCVTINSPDNYCLLTYDELEYLIYELKKTDISTLSIMLVDMYVKIKDANIKIPTDYVIETIEPVKDNKPLPAINDNVIPSLSLY